MIGHGQTGDPDGVRLKAALSTDGDKINVAAICRAAGISRQTFYKWRARFLADGPGGFEELSRRPHSSPKKLSPLLEQVERVNPESTRKPAQKKGEEVLEI